MEIKTIENLLDAIDAGQRHFVGWDFEEDDCLQGLDLKGITFERCFLFLDFSNANLSGSKFIDCNIKTADFSGADLTNALIRNCSVECTLFKGANIEGMIFENNGYYGFNLGQSDLLKLISDE